MTWNSFDALMRATFEPLQYAAFFGALVLLGALEAVAASRRARAEYRRRWPGNGALTVLNIMVLGAMPVGAVAAADIAIARGWGLLNQPFVPPLAAFAVGFAVRSLVAYAIHVALHKVPVLWRVHRVHHTDPHVDVSTTVRVHPLEFVITMPVLVAAAVALGIPPAALMVYEVFDAAMAVFTHANLRLPARLDRALRLVLVTPAMHRLHHSVWRPETDSNYGATLSWWDRLFGTYRTPPRLEPGAERLGLADWQGRRATSFWWLLATPFVGPGATGPAAGPAPS